MRALLKLFTVLIFFAGLTAWAEIQTQLPNTMRAGSSGSSGTTQQGPPYDTGVKGPNSAIGTPDTSAVDKESSGAITKKKPAGQIRLDAEVGITPTPSPSPSMTPETELF